MPAEVPFFDPVPVQAALLPELLEAGERVHRHGRFIGGPEVTQLEERLAAYVGVGHCITCSSGTMALLLALMALEIGPGDEVVVPAYTFAAPVEAVLLLGAVPVLADIDAATCNVSVIAVREAITPRTRAIIAVSMYGQPADFDVLQALATANALGLIEDCAQSFGATLHGQRSGGFGHISCTSFFPTKPLGGCGDGGALFTRDPKLAQALRELRDHGQSSKYSHTRLGFNGRLDTLACASLLVKLAHFPGHLARRLALAERYDRELPALLHEARLPVVRAGIRGAQALYCVHTDRRDELHQRLAEAGIASAIHYPLPLHRQPAFAGACRWSALPIAERAAAQGLCLPLYVGLSDQQQDRVFDALAAVGGAEATRLGAIPA